MSDRKSETMEGDFNKFMECLKKACAKIDKHYFQLSVAGRKKPVFRERVYCYELYHQLRNALGDDFPYKLYGEVDKSGHPVIRGEKKPDFIVHEPGKMNRNLVVIEVKPITVKDYIGRLVEDLKTLQSFIDEAKYYRAIMLVYGDGKQELPKRIISSVKRFSKRCKGRILMVWHRGPGEEPRIIK